MESSMESVCSQETRPKRALEGAAEGEWRKKARGFGAPFAAMLGSFSCAPLDVTEDDVEKALEMERRRDESAQRWLRESLRVDRELVASHTAAAQQVNLVDQLDLEAGHLDSILVMMEQSYEEMMEASRFYFESSKLVNYGLNGAAVATQALFYQMRLEASERVQKLEQHLAMQIETLRRIQEEMDNFAQGNFTFAKELEGLEQGGRVQTLMHSKRVVAEEQQRLVKCLDNFLSGKIALPDFLETMPGAAVLSIESLSTQSE